MTRKMIVAFCLLACPAVFAQDGLESEGALVTQAAKFPAPKYGFGIELLYEHFRYVEPNFMSDTGDFEGFRLSYARAFNDDRFLLKASGEYAGGATAYDGGLEDGKGHSTPLQASGKDHVYNFDVALAFPQVLSSRTLWSPYLGLGNRHLSDKTEGIGSYHRDIDQIYLPVGGDLTFAANENWKVVFTGEVAMLLYGHVSSRLSEVSSRYEDLSQAQHGGFGCKLALNALGNVNGYLVNVRPFWQHWSIAASERQAGFIEPQNETDFIGLSSGLQF